MVSCVRYCLVPPGGWWGNSEGLEPSSPRRLNCQEEWSQDSSHQVFQSSEERRIKPRTKLIQRRRKWPNVELQNRAYCPSRNQKGAKVSGKMRAGVHGKDLMTDQVRRRKREEEWRAAGLSGQLVVSSRNNPPFDAKVQHFLLDLTQCDKRLQDPGTLFWEKIAYGICGMPAGDGLWACGQSCEERFAKRQRRSAVPSLPSR